MDSFEEVVLEAIQEAFEIVDKCLHDQQNTCFGCPVI
jgi:hypothetical protein